MWRQELVTDNMTLCCPLCDRPVTGANVECNSVHPSVSLSWVWPDQASYQEFYSSSQYHDEQYVLNTGKKCADLYEDAKIAASHRMLHIAASCMDDRRLRMLDVGCGSGAFVNVARAYGHDAYGIDPHPIQLDSIRGDWRDVRGTWDVLTMFDVLEHVLAPCEALRHLHGALALHGMLVVEMPEFNAPNGSWRKHIKPKEHVCLYSKDGAEELYRKCGFEVVEFHRPMLGKLGKMSHSLVRKEVFDEK